MTDIEEICFINKATNTNMPQRALKRPAMAYRLAVIEKKHPTKY